MSEAKKLTVMIYQASDNPLAPAIVSQLKALKNAGFHQDVNVVAQFDPHTPDTPTHIFDVNRFNKLRYPDKPYMMFAGNDPYVRNLVLDKLWEEDAEGKEMRGKLQRVLAKEGRNYVAPVPTHNFAKQTTSSNGNCPKGDAQTAAKPQPAAPTQELSPFFSLGNFLDFCAQEYPAENYILFILGHGVLVANDVFLFDENGGEGSMSLKQLKEVLEWFRKKVGSQKLQLIGLHSCSMSSMELIYELQGLANNIIASQGPEFVNSWPNREILIRLIKDQIATQNNRDEAPSVDSTIDKIFDYILFHSYDFQLAGYSFDATWCRLNEVPKKITEAISELSLALRNGLTDATPLCKQAILIAHWDAQSFWQEMYTDIRDFCLCLQRRCEEINKSATTEKEALQRIMTACEVVSNVLQNSRQRARDVRAESGRNGDAKENGEGPLIVRSEFAGPEYQYSNGLSVYFPWSEPLDHDFWNREYPAYEFCRATGWDKFLQDYFRQTMRKPRFTEQPSFREVSLEQQMLEEITRKLFNAAGGLSRHAGTLAGEKAGGGSALGQGEKAGGGSALEKPGGGSGTGIGCDCPSIKNYPSFTREREPEKTTTASFPYTYMLER